MSAELQHIDNAEPERDTHPDISEREDDGIDHEDNGNYLGNTAEPERGESLGGASDRTPEVPETKTIVEKDEPEQREPVDPKPIVIRDMRIGSTAVSSVREPAEDKTATKHDEDIPEEPAKALPADHTKTDHSVDNVHSDRLDGPDEHRADEEVRQHPPETLAPPVIPIVQIEPPDKEQTPRQPAEDLRTEIDEARIEQLPETAEKHVVIPDSAPQLDTTKQEIDVEPEANSKAKDLDIQGELDRISELKGSERQAAILRLATTQLRGEGELDKYLTDACGMIEQKIGSTMRAGVGDYIKEGNLRYLATEMAKYASQTDRTDLARTLFAASDPKNQWDIYATACENSENPDLISDWRNQLDTEFEHSSDEDRSPEANASRLLALVRVSVNGLIGDDPNTLKMALDYRDKLYDEIQKLNGDQRGAYIRGATTAFARAGIVEGVTELSPKFWPRHDPAKSRNTALTTKAVAGSLGLRERAELKMGGATGKVLRWIDSYQKGDHQDPPDIQYEDRKNSIQDQRLMQDIAPELMVMLGVTPTSIIAGLEMSLAGRDYESARDYYAQALDMHESPEWAAMLMSLHHDEIESAAAAHNAFEGDFMGDLALAREHIDAYRASGSDEDTRRAVKDELDGIFKQVSELQDPVTSLPARASLLQLFLELEPDAKQAGELITQIESNWTILEQREGGDEELVTVYQQLKDAGMDFERQWKFQGYIGFVPLSPLRANRTPDWEHTPNKERGQNCMVELANMKLAAERLNWYLGEYRYEMRFENPADEHLADEINNGVYKEGRDSGIRLSSSKGPVTLEGSWKSLYPTLRIWDYKEFERAADAVRSGWQLHTKQALTAHLEGLIGQTSSQHQDQLN